MSRRDRERFVEKVEKTSACWRWGGATVNGYGSFGIGSQTYLAHRVAYYIEHGKNPTQINHKCDNRLCVNHDHLYGGTQKQNVRDMIARSPTLRRNLCLSVARVHGKLNEEMVIRIRDAYSSGQHSCRKLGRMFDVSGSTVSNIVRGKTWKHLEIERRNGRAKLDSYKVQDIRTRYAKGDVSSVKLAAEFGVSKTVVLSVIHQRSWAHVKPPPRRS